MENSEKMKVEILRKLDRLSLANIDISNGMHVTTYHVGIPDEEMRRRQKQDRKAVVSSFTDENIVNVCLYQMFSDEYFLDKALLPFLINNAVYELEFEYDLYDCGTVGRVVLPNGGVQDTSTFRVILNKNLTAERDLYTGMPFTVVTMYPIND